jgi:hypothetical protein
MASGNAIQHTLILTGPATTYTRIKRDRSTPSGSPARSARRKATQMCRSTRRGALPPDEQSLASAIRRNDVQLERLDRKESNAARLKDSSRPTQYIVGRGEVQRK